MKAIPQIFFQGKGGDWKFGNITEKLKGEGVRLQEKGVLDTLWYVQEPEVAASWAFGRQNNTFIIKTTPEYKHIPIVYFNL